MTDALSVSPSIRPRALPHPPRRVPWLGDVLTTDFAKPCQRLVQQARELGPVFEQKLFGYPAVIVTGPRAIDEVNNEELWEKHIGHSLMKLRPLAGDGLFTAFNREPNWAKAHNILLGAFTKTAMADYHAAITGTVRELTDVWSAGSGQSWIDIPADSNTLTFEIMSRAGFSHSFGAMSDPNGNPFVETMVRELTYANRRTDVLPWFERIFRKAEYRRHLADLTHAQDAVDGLIEDRKAQPGGDTRDILDRMLNDVDPDSGESLDATNIRNQILTFLVAGSEPLPTPGYFRRARQDTTLCDGRYSFKQKDWVLVLLQAAHRDPAWGPDAEEFNPDRFLPDNIRTLPPRTYKPFGTGPRACIGRQFAYHEIAVTLAAILHQFDLEPDPGYRLDVRETLTLKPAGLRLRAHRRSGSAST